MKLISYHIENYGKIHDADGKFEDGLTDLCEKNGYGKTTLASFIKAMFYGLPTYTTKTKAFDDRQHFYPFNGGKFGGNITFEMQGKTYKIERFFDKKSSKGDEVKVYQNGAPYFGFGEEIGKEIFGIDEESFKKTVFITADEIDISSTHSINERLNRDIASLGEDGDFERAIEALDKAKKELKAARGNNDFISAQKQRVLDLSAQISNLKDMSEGLQEEYLERERLQKALLTLEKLQKTANERNLVLQKWETAERMERQADEKRARWAEINAKYPHGIPTEEERALLRECVEAKSSLSGAINTLSFGQDKEAALQGLEEKFRKGLPSDEALDGVQADIHRAEALTAEAEGLKNRVKTQKEGLLEGKFALRRPSEEDLSQMRQAAEDYKRADIKIKEVSANLASAPQSVKKSSVWSIAIVLAVAMALVGGALLFVYPAIGAGVLACAAAVLVGGIINAKKGVNSTMPPSNINAELVKLQAEQRMAEEKLRAYTVPYGYYGNAGALYDFASLEEDLTVYNEYAEAEQARQAKIVSLTEQIRLLQEKTRAFFAKYNENAEKGQRGVNALRADAHTYKTLLADKQSALKSGEGLRQKQKDNQAQISALLEKYGFSPLVATMDGLRGLELDCKALLDTRKEGEMLVKNLADYKAQNGLTERPETEKEDLDDLHARLSSVRRGLADCDKRIAETERYVEQLPDYQSALERAEELLKEYKEKHALLADTISALQEADTRLKERYIAPIKERFSHYAEALERVLDEKVRMDADLHIVFERGGEDRSERHLSAGERSICALCLRLALIDNMYETETPFIVMDDPFVHLDEEHLKRAKALLLEVSKTRQIVYFSCHESRQMVL